MIIPKKYTNIDHMVHFYLNLYYEEVEKNPHLRTNTENHIHEINRIDEAFKKTLSNHYNRKLFDYEENKDKFLTKIDDLTQVFTNIKKKAEKQEEIRRMTQECLGINQ